MLARAKERIWPSLSCNNWANILRQPSGETKGNKPSITSTSPKASQSVSLSKIYFFAAGAAAPGPPLRNTLKNSDDEGSSTITSLLLANDALYASRLR